MLENILAVLVLVVGFGILVLIALVLGKLVLLSMERADRLLCKIEKVFKRGCLFAKRRLAWVLATAVVNPLYMLVRVLKTVF